MNALTMWSAQTPTAPGPPSAVTTRPDLARPSARTARSGPTSPLRTLDPRRTATGLIWLAGGTVVAVAALAAARYGWRSSIRPFLGPDRLPISDVMVAGLLVVLGLALIAGNVVLAGRRLRWAIAAGFGLLIGLRLLFLSRLDGALVSDYAGYWTIANGMLAGQGFWTWVPPGFPLLEAGAIAIVGPRIVAGELLNLVMAITAGGAIVALTRRAWGDRAAVVALTTFAILPSQLLFGLILGTETTYGAFLAVVALAAAVAGSGRLPLVALCGVIVGLSQYVRPTSLAIVPAIVLVLVLAAVTWRSGLRAAVVLVLAFALTVAPIVAWNASVNHRLSVSASLFDKWTIYIGLNTTTTGHFSTREREIVAAAAGVPVVPAGISRPGGVFSDEVLAQARAFNDAAGVLLEQRIRDNGVRSLTIQPAKFALMWQSADYPVNLIFGPPSKQPDPRAAAVSAFVAQAAWVLLLVGALGGLWRARRERPVEGLLVLLIVLGAVAVHTLAEVQPRYHEYFVPLLCVLAGALATGTATASRSTAASTLVATGGTRPSAPSSSAEGQGEVVAG